MITNPSARPLIFGEVLFDCFDQYRVLGGAPFNVAWNLKGFGLNPLVITAVGRDDLGAEVLREMSSWGLDARGVQVHSTAPTGRVDVRLQHGQPSYVFWSDVAFDHIRLDSSLISQQPYGLLVHGSLALRHSETMETLRGLRKVLNCPVFLDVNLRLPHFDWEEFRPLLMGVDHVKMNREELEFLYELEHGVPSPEGLDVWAARRQAAEALMACWKIGNLWLSAGCEGAAWVGAAGGFAQVDGTKLERLVDTVGAGDALAAVIIRGILTGVEPERALRQAVSFAGRVCCLPGATTRDPQFYRLFEP